MKVEDEIDVTARWRLILGKYSTDALSRSSEGRSSPPGNEGEHEEDGGQRSSAILGKRDAARDSLLEYIYSREYAGRGVRESIEAGEGRFEDGDGDGGEDRQRGLAARRLSVPEWIRGVRDLFPSSASEVIARHAIEKYGLTELVTDRESLEKLEPSYELLKTLLSFKELMDDDVLEVARRMVRQIVQELKSRLASEVTQAFSSRSRQRSRRSTFSGRLDFTRTIRRNLKNFDVEKQRLIVDQLHFFSRADRRLPWDIIIAVDASASMMDSVIHSAVIAGVFHELAQVRSRFLLFDTSVIDLSDDLDDPVDLLMGVTLGGGTDIAQAVSHCASLVEQPGRTVLVLISDLYEGGDETNLIATSKELCGSGVRMLTLASLDRDARPCYDRRLARRLAEVGVDVAALTPERLSEWLAQVIS